jgi:hypothetical protein
MGDTFRVTREKVTRLIEELRTWELGEARSTIHDLARKYGLDPFIVQRIAISENIHLQRGYSYHGFIFEDQSEAMAIPDYIDEDADTEPLDVKK